MGADRGHRVGSISVKVVSANNLKNTDLMSKSDPYCKVSLLLAILTYSTCIFVLNL